MISEVLQRARLATGALLAATVLASACAGQSGVAPVEVTATPAPTPETTTASTAPAAPSVYGGTIVVGFADWGAPRSLNPLLESPDAAVLDLLAPAIFAHGYDVDPDSGEYLPDLFAAVPSLENGGIVANEDGTLDVKLEIVDGAIWADRTPITAADLEFTYRLITDPALPIRADLADLYSAVVAGSPVADGRTLTFRMRTGTDPTALFSIVVPRHAVESSDVARDWTDRIWASGGPYVVTDWQPGQFVELGRNENYWKVTQAEGAPLPFLDRIVVRFFEPGPDLDSRLVDGFERGELDVVSFSGSEDATGAFAEALAAGAEAQTTPSGEWEHLNFQFGPANRNGATANASGRFRELVAMSIDREALAAARGTAVVHSVLGQYVPGLGDGPFSTPFDLEAVREALGSDSPEVLVTIPSDDPLTVALGGDVVTMLRAAGFDAELQLEDAAIFFGTTLDNGSWDVSAWRFGAGFGLGSAVEFMRFFDPDGLPFVGTNYFRWGTVDSTVRDPATARFGALIDALDQAVDPSTIASLLTEAEGILATETIIVPLIQTGYVAVAHWPESVAGVTTNRVQGPLWNADTWRVPILDG